VNKLELTDEQRLGFGLEAGESVRLLDSRRRTILLERTGVPYSTAFPWDCDLSLSADVRSFPLADILHFLHSSSRSGFLHFEAGDHEKSVFLHRGEVVFAASNQNFDRLGNCLLRVGQITAAQFDEARAAYQPPGHFGKVLVERDILSPRELWSGVKVQIEEIVRSLFSYDIGNVLFWEGEVRPDNVVRLALPTRRLIAEGLRRRDELIGFLAELEGPRVRLEANPDVKGDFSGSERAFYEILADEHSFGEVCRMGAVEPLAAARTVRHLQLLGAIKISKSSEDASDIPEEDVGKSSDDEVRACVLDHLKLMAELVAPIVAVEGVAGISERLGQVIEDASRPYPVLLSGLSVGVGGAIDPEELISRALRFPGERDREVRLALGELISYLEFEILNHPKIANPEEYLDDIASMRAQI
jgi:hypothetical protein